MTFQVVLIGSDGLVVASDRREVYMTPACPGEWDSVQRSHVDKFTKSDDESIVCFSAGGPFVMEMARTIVTDCTPKKLSLLEWENKLQSAANGFTRLPQASPSDEIIVIRKDILNSAWLVIKYGGIHASLKKITEWQCLGDNSPARFLPRHLWSMAPVSELKRLAVLTMAYAHKENPSGVSEECDVMTLDGASVFCWERLRVSEGIYATFDSKLKRIFSVGT